MKLRRIITKRKAKWAGLAVCGLLAAVFVSSRWYSFQVLTLSPTGDTCGVAIGAGYVLFLRVEYPDAGLVDRSTTVEFKAFPTPRLRLWMDWVNRTSPSGIKTTRRAIPLWMPLLLVAIPTAWIWRSDRRIQPWQCVKCRYDLRGLEGGGENGVCPECGLPKGEG